LLVERAIVGHVDKVRADSEVADAERAEVEVVVERLCDAYDLRRRGGKDGVVLEANRVVQRPGGRGPLLGAETTGAEDVVGIDRGGAVDVFLIVVVIVALIAFAAVLLGYGDGYLTAGLIV